MCEQTNLKTKSPKTSTSTLRSITPMENIIRTLPCDEGISQKSDQESGKLLQHNHLQSNEIQSPALLYRLGKNCSPGHTNSAIFSKRPGDFLRKDNNKTKKRAMHICTPCHNKSIHKNTHQQELAIIETCDSEKPQGQRSSPKYLLKTSNKNNVDEDEGSLLEYSLHSIDDEGDDTISSLLGLQYLS